MRLLIVQKGKSMIKSADTEKQALDFFVRLGFEASRLAEHPSEKRCDLVITGPDSKYFIETKTRFDNHDANNRIYDDYYKYSEKSFGYDNKLKGILNKAVKQLEASCGNSSDAYKLILIDVRDSFDDAPRYERALSTLLGVQRLRCYIGKEGIEKGCYYFCESGFFSFKQIDGAIIFNNRLPELFVNTFSAKYDFFLTSELHKIFASNFVIRDPYAIPDNSPFILADCSVNRKDKHKVIEFLVKKYGYTRIIDHTLVEHTWTPLANNQ